MTEATGLDADIVTVDSEPASGQNSISSTASFSDTETGDRFNITSTITSSDPTIIQVGASVNGVVSEDGTSGAFNQSTGFSVVGGAGGGLNISAQEVTGDDIGGLDNMGGIELAAALGKGLAGCIAKNAM